MPLLRGNRKVVVDHNGTAKVYDKESIKNSTFNSFKDSSRTNLGSDQEIPVMDDFAEEVNESAAKTKTKTKDGLGAHIKQDGLYTKEFGNDLKNVFNGTSAKNAADAGQAADALGDLKKAGGKFLDGMGRGSKTLGAAKVATYMVGASMLVDMLNPFDDD